MKNWKDEEITVPDGLETKLEQLIDNLAEQEMQTKRRRLWVSIFSVAASIALLLSVSMFFHTQQPNHSQLTAQNIENPELAYLETLKALGKVSVNFNKGMNQLAFVSTEIEKTNYILNKTFNTERK